MKTRRLLAASAALFAMAACATETANSDMDDDAGASDQSMSAMEAAPEPAPAPPPPPPQPDIVDAAVAAGQFTTLATALNAAELTNTLKGAGPFTVFAPTDAAFAALPPATLQTLLRPENKAQLQALLLNHVAQGELTAADLASGGARRAVGGQELTVTAAEGGLQVAGARVVQADVDASNGVIHAIDKVILPPVASAPAKKK